MSFALYLHVPFCTRTCPYCDFYQVPHRAGQREAAFVEAVLLEARQVREELDLAKRKVATLYWGGGTPSLLAPATIERLAAGLRGSFSFACDLEFTVEANPGEAGAETLRALRRAGANRLSLGCQSFQPERLAFLGRLHTPDDNRRALAEARAQGFENVSVDLIFNLPPEFPREQWRRDVEEVVALAPEHVSAYGLTLEPRTPFGRRAGRGALRLLEPEEYAEEYLWAAAALEAAGYLQYETSSFARPGRESRHNSRYWAGGDYVGLGPGAHSLWSQRRWANVRSLERWIAGVSAGTPARELDDTGGGSEPYAETLYLGLRSRRGLALEALRGDVGSVRRLTAGLLDSGLARQEGERLVLTAGGHLLLDEIVSRLLALDPAA
ncbi:MAG: radical SAM family heme chaperone HemW [Gemmatimonadota bacterium]